MPTISSEPMVPQPSRSSASDITAPAPDHAEAADRGSGAPLLRSSGAPLLRSSGAPLLRAEDVARRLGVSKAWVMDHAAGRRRPFLPSLKLGRAVRFEPAAVDRFIEECRRVVTEKGRRAA